MPDMRTPRRAVDPQMTEERRLKTGGPSLGRLYGPDFELDLPPNPLQTGGAARATRLPRGRRQIGATPRDLREDRPQILAPTPLKSFDDRQRGLQHEAFSLSSFGAPRRGAGIRRRA